MSSFVSISTWRAGCLYLRIPRSARFSCVAHGRKLRMVEAWGKDVASCALDLHELLARQAPTRGRGRESAAGRLAIAHIHLLADLPHHVEDLVHRDAELHPREGELDTREGNGRPGGIP